MPDNFTSYLRPNLSPASCPNNAIAFNGASSNLQKCRIKHFFINRFPLKERLQHIFKSTKISVWCKIFVSKISVWCKFSIKK